MSESFAVWQFYDDDWHDCVARDLGAREALLVARDIVETRPEIGQFAIVRVIVVDGGDATVFEWKRDEGITFPPQRVQ